MSVRRTGSRGGRAVPADGAKQRPVEIAVVARQAGVRVTLVRRYVEFGLVQPVGLQATEAFVTFTLDLACAKAAGTPRIIEAELGGNDHVVAGGTILHPVPDRGLALPALATLEPRGVEISGIDESSAVLAEQIHQPEGGLTVDFAADQIRPQTESADLKT